MPLTLVGGTVSAAATGRTIWQASFSTDTVEKHVENRVEIPLDVRSSEPINQFDQLSVQ